MIKKSQNWIFQKIHLILIINVLHTSLKQLMQLPKSYLTKNTSNQHV